MSISFFNAHFSQSLHFATLRLCEIKYNCSHNSTIASIGSLAVVAHESDTLATLLATIVGKFNTLLFMIGRAFLVESGAETLRSGYQ